MCNNKMIALTLLALPFSFSALAEQEASAQQASSALTTTLIKMQTPCLMYDATYNMTGSEGRLKNDVTYSVKGAAKGAPDAKTKSISGKAQKGALQGKTTGLYVGKSAFNDLLFISQVSDESGAVIGHNLTFSMCGLSTQNGSPLISDKRAAAGLMVPKDIVIQADEASSFGKVLSAQNVLLRYEKHEGQPAFDAYTSFAPIMYLGSTQKSGIWSEEITDEARASEEVKAEEQKAESSDEGEEKQQAESKKK